MPLDLDAQIGLLDKMKLDSCARPGNRAGIFRFVGSVICGALY
jgi:hypothetical protein